LKVTIKDVAKEAGVSIATVSRVLNGANNVSKETRKQVLKAIKKLGYKPLRVKTTISGVQPKTVGIMVPDIFAYHYSDIAENADRYLRAHGFETFIYMFHRKIEEERLGINYFFMSRVDGLIVCTSKEDDEYLKALEETAIPIVTVDRENKDFRFDSVNIDNFKAGGMVAEYLFKKGHKNILHVTGSLNVYSIEYRMKGFLKKGKKYGMEIKILEGSFDIGYVYDLVSSYLRENGKDFTAIFASSDMIALEVLKALHDSGVKVPDDVSVIGFDDAYYSQYSIPALTTVRQPRADMGKSAAQLLIDRIMGDKKKVVRKVILPTDIVERESVLSID